MEIVKFTSSMLSESAAVAQSIWGNDVPPAAESDKKLMFEFLIRFYFFAASPFNFALKDDDGNICGALFGHVACIHGDHAGKAFLAEHPELLKINNFSPWTKLLEFNRLQEEKVMAENEIVLDLFMSRRKGGGRMLMNAFSEACRQANIKSMILWTDDCCDFDYYNHNHFTQVGEFYSELGKDRHKTFLFRKNF